MTDHDEDPVLLDYPEPGVARLTLNRPLVNNALSLKLQALLSEYFLALGDNPEIRCILLTGGDKVFAAGGDISSMADTGPIDIYQRHTERVWAPIQHCP
ncbi:MAG: enoyl-CoA hydratase, partial [Gammaproteobacteria bacterium]|nr:enoyl-CoA hydratase [Gammaproteobacteria bacterium]